MRSTLFASLLATSTVVAQDQDKLTLGNGDLFLGKVIALEDGLIELKSPHSKTPLKIINKSLQRLSFGSLKQSPGDEGALPVNSQEIVLGNGDRFPGELMALDEENVIFQTWFTGDLPIKRSQIQCLLFGKTPQKAVFRGPGELDQWEMDNSRSWSIRDQRLIARQRSSIGRDLNLPENFTLRSKVTWTESPSFRIHLCSSEPSVESDSANGSYLVTFGTSSVQLQRILEGKDGGKIYQRLFNNEVFMRTLGAKDVDIELRVDRSSSMVYLYLDGRKAGQGFDPNEPPRGSSVIYDSQSHSSSNLIVEGIEVDEWDTSTHNLRLEPRAGDEFDTLSVEDGDRFSGEILSYDPTEDNESFSIKTSLSPEPLTIPLAHCAVMYFAREPEEEATKTRYQINLRIGGKLTVSQITLGPDRLTATHPWLGTLKIDRRVVESITKS